MWTRRQFAQHDPAPSGRRGHWLTMIVAGLMLLLCTDALWAQDPKKAADEEDGPPAPEDIELATKDGVQLHCTWYPSDVGNEAAAIILLHALHGSRADYRNFALFLQREHGHAVIVPDLRGHGDSTLAVAPDGTERRLDPERFRPDDFDRMASEDVEAVKRFLIKRNNAGELNIERLGIVGAEMGAMVGILWSYADWEADQLPTIKQGRDVKALVLISPEVKFKNIQSSLLAQPPVRGALALQIVAGQGSAKAVKNARQIHNLLKRYYPEPPKETQRLLFLDVSHYKTSLQGTKMLGERLDLEERIAKFFELRLVQPPYPWKERKSPL